MPMEETPRYRVVIEFGRSIKRVEALDKSTSVKRRRRRIEATVNSNSIHEIVVIRYECALHHGASCAGTI